MSIHKEFRDYYKNQRYLNNSYQAGREKFKEEVLQLLFNLSSEVKYTDIRTVNYRRLQEAIIKL